MKVPHLQFVEIIPLLLYQLFCNQNIPFVINNLCNIDAGENIDIYNLLLGVYRLFYHGFPLHIQQVKGELGFMGAIGNAQLIVKRVGGYFNILV